MKAPQKNESPVAAGQVADQSTENTPTVASSAVTAKDFATVVAKLAIKGHSLHSSTRAEDGRVTFVVSRGSKCHNFSHWNDVRGFLAQIQVAESEVNVPALLTRKADVRKTVGIISATMMSREIADLVESRHDDVKRSIERLAAKGVIQLPPLADVKNHQGQTVSEYRIGKRDSYVIVAQLSPEFTARLVDRWQELEAGSMPVLPKTMAEALRLAADQSEQIEAQAVQLAIAAPKVQFVDQYVTTTGDKGFREVCKVLNANERKFGRWLDDTGITYWLAGKRTAYAQHVHAGRFVTKTGMAGGEGGHAFNQLKFTPKGVAWVAGEWAKCHQSQGGAM